MSNFQPPKIVIIYAKEDEPALLQLKIRLRPLENRSALTIWDVSEVLPGGNLDDAIKVNLEIADIVLPLISSDFFNSTYIENDEFKKVYKRHQKGEVVVIPVILRACTWDFYPEISDLELLPKDGKPISNWIDLDDAWENVVRGVLRATNNLQALKEVNSAVHIFYGTFSNDLGMGFYFNILKSREKKPFKKYKQAVKTLLKYADNDDKMTGAAFHVLNQLYSIGDIIAGKVEKDPKKALKFLLKGAQKGWSPSQYKLGQFYESGEDLADIEEAVIWFRRAANQGDQNAKEALQRLGYTE